ncbi:tetratricopeptide repeat protein [Inquilinus sp. CAU 1745]|uniref:tetratricopeptide repeat protein n=1 Tax=Inquilinus sp. CAU 1745 TaxID=3140369 RepID=UPI00325BB310
MEQTVQDILQQAVERHRAGQLEEARLLYREVLARQPDQPDALHFLGVIAVRDQDLWGAMELIGRAIAVDPNVPSYYVNFGNILKLLKKPDEAIACYERALALEPDQPEALISLGTLYRSQGSLDRAEETCRRALALQPDSVEGCYILGATLRQAGRPEEAVAELEKALSFDPAYDPAHELLGRHYHTIGRWEEAVRVFDRWLAHSPGHPTALHMRAACSGDETPERASDGFVRILFDRFAVSFDDQLLGRLSYRVPELIADAALPWLRSRGEKLSIIDAGCGTGLCGLALKPFARRMIGVDLSPNMLKEAARRELYDELAEAELGAYFDAPGEEVELIVCGDTLVYFGVLENILRGMSGRLAPDGRIIFTVEALAEEADGPGFHLNAHGRYSHKRSYMARTAEESGLTVLSLEEVTLRLEGKEPVAGYLVVAEKE